MLFKGNLVKRWLGLYMAAVLAFAAMVPAAALANDAKDVITGKIFLYKGSVSEPLANATVMLRDGGNVSAQTDSSGAYKLEIPANRKSEDKQYTISIASPDQYHRILEGTTAYGGNTRTVTAGSRANDFYFIDTAQVIQIFGTLYEAETKAPITDAYIISGYTIIQPDSKGSFDYTGTVLREITIVAPGRSVEVIEVPLVSYMTGVYYIGSKNLTKSAAVPTLSGNVYLYNRGVPTELAGVTVSIHGIPGASAVSDDEGFYSIHIPVDGRKDDNQYTISIRNPNVSHSILSADRSQWGDVARSVNAQVSNDIYYVNANPNNVKYYGHVMEYKLDSGGNHEGKAIQGAQLQVFGFNWRNTDVKTDAQGYFEVSARVDDEVNVAASASGYQGRSYNAAIDIIELLKNGSANIGTIYLLKDVTCIPGNVSVSPNTVNSSQMSSASVHFASETAIGKTHINVLADNFAFILGETAGQVKLYKNGAEIPLSASDVKLSNKNMRTVELRVTLSAVSKNDQYRLDFGVQAPHFDALQASYNLSALVFDPKLNGYYTVGVETVFVNDIRINPPADVKQGDTSLTFNSRRLVNEAFVVEYTVFPNNNPNNVIHRVSFNYGQDLMDMLGSVHHVTTLLGISPLQTGGMSIRGRILLRNLIEMASDTKTFNVSAKPISVSQISITTQHPYNGTTTLNVPSQGQQVGTIVLSLWDRATGTLYGTASSSSQTGNWGTKHPVSASVTFANADRIRSASLVMPSDLGEHVKTAVKSGNTFTAGFTGSSTDKILAFRSSDSTVRDIVMRVVTTSGETLNFVIGTVRYQWDPSGYIYDAVTKKRIAGATVTLWWKNPKNDEWEIFPGKAFGITNPMITNENGEYEFVVPIGEYRVEVEAEGYETTDNIKARYGPIKVLPIHTEVNIGMTPKK